MAAGCAAAPLLRQDAALPSARTFHEPSNTAARRSAFVHGFVLLHRPPRPRRTLLNADLARLHLAARVSASHLALVAAAQGDGGGGTRASTSGSTRNRAAGSSGRRRSGRRSCSCGCLLVLLLQQQHSVRGGRSGENVSLRNATRTNGARSRSTARGIIYEAFGERSSWRTSAREKRATLKKRRGHNRDRAVSQSLSSVRSHARASRLRLRSETELRLRSERRPANRGHCCLIATSSPCRTPPSCASE